MQTKKWSFYEVVFNTLTGLLLSIFVVQPIVFAQFDVDFGIGGNTTIAVIFTIVSMARGYASRRFFIWIHIRFHTNLKEML